MYPLATFGVEQGSNSEIGPGYLNRQRTAAYGRGLWKADRDAVRLGFSRIDNNLQPSGNDSVVGFGMPTVRQVPMPSEACPLHEGSGQPTRSQRRRENYRRLPWVVAPGKLIHQPALAIL